MKIFVLLILFFSIVSLKAQTLPKIEREFRAVWIATVDNVDFPTTKNLSIEEQKAELIKDLELAKSLKMNAVFSRSARCAMQFMNRKSNPGLNF